MSDEGKLETQCWICPICYDDHKYNEERSFCKTEDLKELRGQHDFYRELLRQYACNEISGSAPAARALLDN